MPATRGTASLLSVDRAVFELRRGRMVCVAAADGACALVMAAAGATLQTLSDLQSSAGQAPILAITRRRAEVLGLASSAIATTNGVLMASRVDGLDAEAVLRLADPLTRRPDRGRPGGSGAPGRHPRAAKRGGGPGQNRPAFARRPGRPHRRP